MLPDVHPALWEDCVKQYVTTMSFQYAWCMLLPQFVWKSSQYNLQVSRKLLVELFMCIFNMPSSKIFIQQQYIIIVLLFIYFWYLFLFILYYYCIILIFWFLLTVLWHYWLGIRKSIWPVKKFSDEVLASLCLERGSYCLHMVHLMPLPLDHLMLH